MGLLELFLIAVGLSMDAFAVAVCKGLSLSELKWKDMLIVGLYFGIFQAVMPLLGYLVGSQFADVVQNVDHWIAFVLLALIGSNMIRESRKKDDCDNSCEGSLRPKIMLPMAVATSVDALTVGISFAFLQVRILPAVLFIGVTTLVLSMLGVRIGHEFGARYKSRAELAGGIILILMGLKILLEHLGILA